MKYPLVQVETSDGFWLHGLYIPADKKETIFVHVHGTASNFYEEDFIEVMTEKLSSKSISMLSTNNRGAGVYDAWDNKGAAVEIFEECLLDIDAWIEFALEKGYKKIILSGHSLGTEKVVYYMNKGAYRDKVSAVVLLAPADSPKWRDFDKKFKVPITGETGKERVMMQITVAQKMVSEGQGDQFMDRSVYGGLMPKSAKSFLNFLGENTEILKALPLHSGKLEFYSKIAVPIFVAIGDQEEYTAIPITEALDLMKKENKRAETVQLKGCNHDFEGCEETMSDELLAFLSRISL